MDTVATRPRLPREARGLSCGRIDAVEAVRLRGDAIAATALSDTPGRPRLGPKRLKIGTETSHDLA